MTLIARDVMVGTDSCAPETKLAAAVEIVCSRNCGILPIVNGQQKVIGEVTDREICIAPARRRNPC